MSYHFRMVFVDTIKRFTVYEQLCMIYHHKRIYAPIRRYPPNIRVAWRRVIRFLRKVMSGKHGWRTIIINPNPLIKSHFVTKTFYVTHGMIVNYQARVDLEIGLSEQTKFPSGGYKCCPYNFAMRNDVHAKAYLASRIDIEAGRVTWPETSKDLYARGISVYQGGLWKPIGRRADRHSMSRGTPTSHAILLCSRIESQISKFA